ncbi:MAG: AMP-binding protein [Proteobacteria bacterium]|nr:AMP-binding protein [Pseudomonadota bacterium]
MKDTKGERAPVGDHIVEIVTFVNSEKFKSFFDQKVKKRGKEYKELKDRIADNMIHAAEKFIPGLMDNIVIREVSTPATNYTYTNSPEGNIYGPAQTVVQSGPNRFSITGPLDGLFLSGASVISAGVFPCAASGFWAGKKALKRIQSLENRNVSNRDKPLNNNSHRLTSIQKIRYWSSIKPLETALKFRNNNPKWLEMGWKEYEAKVFQVAKGLIKLGIKKGESIAIISENRPEWLFAQMGIIASGGIFTSINPTDRREEIAYIVNHSKSQYIFIDHQTQYDKVTTVISEMGCLKKIIHFDLIDEPHLQRSISFEDLINLGEPILDQEVEQILDELNPDDTVQYLYTSGTTALPKGVPITHKSLDTMGVVTSERFPVEEGVQLYSCLPLNNIMEQTVSTLIHLEKGGVLSLCPKSSNLKEFLPEVRPYLLLATPLIWKRLEILLKKEFEKQPHLKRRVISWARRVEYSSFLKELKFGRSFKSNFRKLANNFVLNNIREELGMDRVIFALNASEPVSIETQRFFISLGIIITNLYGMCESAGIISTTDPARPRPGIVGTPLRGSELKISWDGELLVKGPTLAQKYLKDTKNTHQLWHEGWMQTGDLAIEPKPGAIRIKGRKKEILMTAGEVSVNPYKIESYLTAIACIAQAVVIGNNQPYFVCLLTLDEEETSLLAGSLGISGANIESISETPEFLEYLEQRIRDDVNNRLTHAEGIRNFMIIPHPFSIESGELTATQKIKRRVVNEKYRAEIMALYR